MSLIAIVAGEASGDQLGSHLIDAIIAQRPDAKFIGIAGSKMQTRGAKSLYPMEMLSLHGYGWDVLSAAPGLLRMRKKLAKSLIEMQPDVFIGIDAPDFNFGLEKMLKQSGIPTLHYVSPSIWAWRKHRLSRIKASVSHMLALFPFEPAIYAAENLAVTYVGHPLADMLPMVPSRSEAREQLQIGADKTVIALLPGSRVSEIRQHARLMIQTAKRLAQDRPNCLFLIPVISRATKDILEQAMYQEQQLNVKLPQTDEIQKVPDIRILFGHAHLALQAADSAIVASGTATLEAALLKCPMIVMYKLSWLSWQFLRHMNYLPYVSLPNILAGKFIVPEFLQNKASPENLANAIHHLLDTPEAREIMVKQFSELHYQLRQNTAQKVAQVVLKYLRPQL